MYDSWQKATQRTGQTGKEFGAYLQSIRSQLLDLVLSTQNRARDGDWDAFLKSWLPVSQSSDPIYPSLLFLDVTGGVDICGQLFGSRSNTANVNLCCFSSILLVRVRPIMPEAKAQGSRISTQEGTKDSLPGASATTAQKPGCHAEGLADTSTIDGFQGRESSVVILDLVRTEGLGFLEQEPRATVAFSRCRDSFIIVGNTAIIENGKFQSWKVTKKNSDGIQSQTVGNLVCRGASKERFRHQARRKGIREDFATVIAEEEDRRPQRDLAYTSHATRVEVLNRPRFLSRLIARFARPSAHLCHLSYPYLGAAYISNCSHTLP